MSSAIGQIVFQIDRALQRKWRAEKTDIRVGEKHPIRNASYWVARKGKTADLSRFRRMCVQLAEDDLHLIFVSAVMHICTQMIVDALMKKYKIFIPYVGRFQRHLKATDRIRFTPGSLFSGLRYTPPISSDSDAPTDSDT